MNEYGIAAFRSRQQVMKFENALRRAGIGATVISTPREVAVGCGLSVRFAPGDMQAVQKVLARTKPENLIGLYLVGQQGGKTRLTAVSKRS